MEKLKQHWWKVPKLVRQAVVLVVGFVVIIVGVILIPLPGPGWLVVFLGFAILAIEFERADKVKQAMMNFIKQATDKLKTYGRRKP